MEKEGKRGETWRHGEATDVRGFAPQNIGCSWSWEPEDGDYSLKHRGYSGGKVQLGRGSRQTTAGRARRR